MSGSFSVNRLRKDVCFIYCYTEASLIRQFLYAIANIGQKFMGFRKGLKAKKEKGRGNRD